MTLICLAAEVTYSSDRVPLVDPEDETRLPRVPVMSCDVTLRFYDSERDEVSLLDIGGSTAGEMRPHRLMRDEPTQWDRELAKRILAAPCVDVAGQRVLP